MSFLRRTTSLVVVLSAEVAAVVAVHRLGNRRPFDLPLDDLEPWLRAAPDDALLAALRVVALVVAGWLLVATTAYACARAASVPAAIRACEWATPRAIRRTVDRALAASIVAGTVALHAHAAGAVVRDPRPQVSVDVRSGKRLGSLPTARARPVVLPPAPAATPSAPEAPSIATVVLAPGDNLWEVSAAALAARTGRERVTLGDDEIARYWRAVCDANRDTLRSGDVNLVYPGETVVLPPLT